MDLYLIYHSKSLFSIHQVRVTCKGLLSLHNINHSHIIWPATSPISPAQLDPIVKNFGHQSGYISVTKIPGFTDMNDPINSCQTFIKPYNLLYIDSLQSHKTFVPVLDRSPAKTHQIFIDTYLCSRLYNRN